MIESDSDGPASKQVREAVKRIEFGTKGRKGALSLTVHVRDRDEMNDGGKDMVKVKSSQKIFTDAEVANLTGICMEHLHDLARTRHVGFIARAAEAAGKQADQWLFTLSDLMVLAMLYQRCQH
jgi:hypothetical protein